ncbi:Uncharacterised protein [Serratia fonticola]|uniref:Uncharacterized protein n=1 Tax=Serratia fonticola TaxID=47917 RepID=A0A4U9UHL7_SERFO|nr:Uncharacterised protein [Serratia fonticola]
MPKHSPLNTKSRPSRKKPGINMILNKRFSI